MFFSYDSETRQVGMDVSDIVETGGDTIWNKLRESGDHRLLSACIAGGINRVILQYLIEVCDDVSRAKKVYGYILEHLVESSVRSFLPGSVFYTDFLSRQLGLPEDYLQQWISEEANCGSQDEFASKYDYLDPGLNVKYSVSEEEICVFLGNGTETLMIRRFAPGDPSEFCRLCAQAVCIAYEALNLVYEEESPFWGKPIDDVIDHFTRKVRGEYESFVREQQG